MVFSQGLYTAEQFQGKRDGTPVQFEFQEHDKTYGPQLYQGREE